MKLKDFMDEITLKPDFKGIILADDYVLAINISGSGTTDPGEYEIVEEGLKTANGQLNPQEKTTAYIRRGQQTTKTGTQRTFSLDMDRYIGDPVQDFFDSFAIKYGTGQECVVDYVNINRINGKGEKGKLSVIVNTDSGGGSQENSVLSVDLKSTGVKPEEYTYTKTNTVKD